MLSLKLAGKTIKEKIAYVRKEISVRHVQFHTMKTMSAHVYYDQIEELHSVLHKLKNKDQIDPLDKWCAENPSDLECRVYDD